MNSEVWELDGKKYVKSGEERSPKKGEAYLVGGDVLIAKYDYVESEVILVQVWERDGVGYVKSGEERPVRAGDAYLFAGRVYTSKNGGDVGDVVILVKAVSGASSGCCTCAITSDCPIGGVGDDGRGCWVGEGGGASCGDCDRLKGVACRKWDVTRSREGLACGCFQTATPSEAPTVPEAPTASEAPTVPQGTTCLDCTMKHLGCSLVCLDEIPRYPGRIARVIGHLHEAARECPSAELSREIDELRVGIGVADVDVAGIGVADVVTDIEELVLRLLELAP